MFRVRCVRAPRGAQITTFILASSAALGCMNDSPLIVDGAVPAPLTPTSASTVSTDDDGVDGALDPSSVDPANPSSPASPDTQTGVSPSDETPSDETPVGAGGAAVILGSSGAAGAPGGSAGTGGAGGDGCWQLPVVERARLFPAQGQAAALAGGKIVGSNASATNGFVDLAVIAAAPAEGEWLEVDVPDADAYRYVKYYSPGGSYGAVAELELYSGGQRLEGAAFGSAGSLDDTSTVFENALDGDTSTYFQGSVPNDNYVGLDLGAGHELAAPTFAPGAGAVSAGDSVTLTAPAGASLLYTTDGADPAVAGEAYTGPIVLGAGTTLVKAIATDECALPSPVAQAVFSTGAAPSGNGGAGGSGGSTPNTVQSSIHIGNSLTDTINDHIETLAADGGIALDFNRYSIPGAGTWLYDQNPTGGFGVANVQEALRTRPFDHISMQPAENYPCQPTPSADGDDSDSGYIAMAWSDAMTQNPNVQMWVYSQWPAPTDYVNCITGGGWTRGDWAPEAPQSWEDAIANELAYQEAVRSALVATFPDAPPPYIVPGGLALVTLKHAIEDGQVPGITDFFGTLFQDGGNDIHLTTAGQYFITLVFYGCMFQQSPEGLVNDSGGELTAEQAAVFQRVAQETLEGYPLSGITR